MNSFLKIIIIVLFPIFIGGCFQSAISQKSLLGMSSIQIVSLLGTPNRTYIVENSSGSREQWAYDKNSVYVYFESDIVTFWQVGGN